MHVHVYICVRKCVHNVRAGIIKSLLDVILYYYVHARRILAVPKSSFAVPICAVCIHRASRLLRLALRRLCAAVTPRL